MTYAVIVFFEAVGQRDCGMRDLKVRLGGTARRTTVLVCLFDDTVCTVPLLNGP